MKIRVEIKDPNASFWTEYDGEMVRTAVTRAFLNSAEENLQTVYHRELPWGGAIHGTHSSSHTETITVKFPQSVLNNLKNPTIQIENKEEAPSAESVIKKSKFVKVILVLSIAYCAFIFFALTPRSSIYTKGDPVTIDNAVCDLQGCNKPAECIRYNVNQRTGEQFHKYYVCAQHCSKAGEFSWLFSIDHPKRKRQWEGVFSEPNYSSVLWDEDAVGLILVPLVFLTVPTLIYVLRKTDRERSLHKKK